LLWAAFLHREEGLWRRPSGSSRRRASLFNLQDRPFQLRLADFYFSTGPGRGQQASAREITSQGSGRALRPGSIGADLTSPRGVWTMPRTPQTVIVKEDPGDVEGHLSARPRASRTSRIRRRTRSSGPVPQAKPRLATGPLLPGVGLATVAGDVQQGKAELRESH